MSLSVLDSSITWTEEDIKTIKNMYCKNCNDEEFKIFMHVCKCTGLDPRRNQIYAIKRKEKMTIQTGIDGFRLVAERTGKYSPGREPSYEYDAQGKLVSATAYVKKMTPDGTWHEVSAKAYWSEYCVSYNGQPSDFWKRMPHNQLAKCAECLCLRKAFPSDFSGIYSDDEMDQAKNEINITPEPQVGLPAPAIQIEQDMIYPEVEAWVFIHYREEEKNFMLWLEEIRAKNNWSYRKTIEQLSKKPDYTSQTFQAWLMDRVGL